MKRRADIDLLKGISIIAVVLYHMGFLKSGYLGVDIFFVIGGFLTVPAIVKRVCRSDFHYFTWLKNRIMRLLPLILTVSVICLAIGYFLWLPDDFENLSESVIASTLFSNNILSNITTKDYWNTINEFKPLMHTWYLGILMEFYVIVPLIIIALNRIATLLHKNAVKMIWGGVTFSKSFVARAVSNAAVFGGNKVLLHTIPVL